MGLALTIQTTMRGAFELVRSDRSQKMGVR